MLIEVLKVNNPINKKDLMYVILHNENEYEAINVGLKTYQRIEKLLNPIKKKVNKQGDKNEPPGKMDK